MAEYRFSPAAQRDLDEIFDYTVHEWGVERAARHTMEIERARARLAQAPGLAQESDYIRPGYRRAAVARHVIYFRVEDYGIAIIRILHQRMDALCHL